MKSFHLSFFIALFTLLSTPIFTQCFSEQSFTNPGESNFIVPGTAAENYVIEIEAKGADGGDFLWGGNPQTNGGEGASMKASFIVPGGSDLLIIIGTSGFDAPGSPGGGGGGGGSAVIIDNSEVLIAAGAGGGGGQGGANTGQGGQANTDSPPQGGAGLGSSGGGGFNASGGDGPVSTGGGAGTLNGQGTGGNGGVTAGGGGAGFGGGGGGSGTVGGGGGGYKGGDGSDGSSDLFGKGGDSFVNTLFSSAVIFNTPGLDGGGANNNGSVIITCIPQGSVDIMLESAMDPICFGGFEGSIEVSASGGLAPYQYSLNGGTYGDSPVFTGLTEGTYTITVQDALGDTDMLSVTLTSPSQIMGEIENVIDNVCFGGSEGVIEVSASGGTSANGTYGYSINGSPVQDNGLFTNLANGFYVISIFDDNLCMAQVTTSITSPDNLELIVISQSDLTCFGSDDGSITVEAFGGSPSYTFSIDGGAFDASPTFMNLEAGTHIITVMDEEECTEEVIVFLDEPLEVTFEIVTTENICYGDNEGIISLINISGTPPFLFALNGGDFTPDSTFVGLLAGEYEVTVMDSSQCVYGDDVDLIDPDSLVLEATITMELECGIDSTAAVMLELIGGEAPINYNLNQNINMSGAFENLAAGEYTASATDANGCTSNVSFIIQESATFSLAVDTVVDVSCFGLSNGSFNVMVEGANDPIQYSINGVDFQDTSFFEGLSAGVYTVSVTDSTMCVNEIEIVVDEPDELMFAHINFQNIACYGGFTGSIDFSVSGGNPDYVFDALFPFQATDTVIITDLNAGEYVLNVVDSKGCMIQDTVELFQNDSLQVFISEIGPDSCGVDTTGFVDLNAIGGYAPLMISLNGVVDSAGIFTNLVSGTYVANVVDGLGCMASLEFEILEVEGLLIDSFTVEHVSCTGLDDGSIEIFTSDGVGSISYYVNDSLVSGNEITHLSGGEYSIVAIDELGCSAELEIEIEEPDPLILDLLDVNFDEGCLTVKATGGTQPYVYSIDNKSTFQDSAKFIGLETGDYTIIVVDANGCENSYLFTWTNIENEEFSGLNIFPNPVRNMLFIELDDPNFLTDIQFVDITGKVVKSILGTQLEKQDGLLSIAVDDLSNGTYLLKLKLDRNIITKKIIVVH